MVSMSYPGLLTLPAQPEEPPPRQGRPRPPAQAAAAEIRRRYDGVLDRALIYQPYPSPPGLWRQARIGALLTSSSLPRA